MAIIQNSFIVSHIISPYSRYKKKLYYFVIVSDGAQLRKPEPRTVLCNLDWLLDSVIQNKYLNPEKYQLEN